jgi:ferredoxin
MLKISINRAGELFAKIAEAQSLYLPVEKAGQVDYDKWTADAKVSLNHLNTTKSAKDLFFPQVEHMVDFKLDGKNIEIKPQPLSEEKFVLFGVRACDARSMEILDKVFLADPVDTFYAARRNNGTVVTMACGEPEESCFCSVFGIDATNPGGDVATWMVGGDLYWKALTAKGEALTAAIADIFETADEAVVEEAKKEAAAILAKLPLANLDLSKFKPEALNELFNSDKWAKLSAACLGCGTCTFVCPTCQCYDIRDYDTGHGIQRFRCWDSCMYSDFTMMAHGTNRPDQLQKFRQRFMHKLVYFPSNNDGVYGCVGCGRCVSKCPISMNIAKVIKALGEDK